MKMVRLLVLVLGAAAAVAAGFLVDRIMVLDDLKSRREVALDHVREAGRLAALHPDAFDPSRESVGDLSLKTLVQEKGTKLSLGIAYLSEAEREAGRGWKERQAIVRLRQAPHGRLVSFLAELEREGRGARVKELRLRPSKEKTGVYEDTEIVFSRILPLPGEKP